MTRASSCASHLRAAFDAALGEHDRAAAARWSASGGGSSATLPGCTPGSATRISSNAALSAREQRGI